MPLAIEPAPNLIFGDWLRINIAKRTIEVAAGVSLDDATRRFLNACADHLGAKRPCEGPGLLDGDR